MDVLKLIGDLKGKALDISKVEMLQHIYELQNKQIEQLKGNNEATEDNNRLLKEKLKRVEEENLHLLEKVKGLESKVSHLDSKKEKYDLSKGAFAILRHCISQDVVEFADSHLERSIGLSNIEIEAALSELSECNIATLGSHDPYEGNHYYFTDKGRKILLKLKEIEIKSE